MLIAQNLEHNKCFININCYCCVYREALRVEEFQLCQFFHISLFRVPGETVPQSGISYL